MIRTRALLVGLDGATFDLLDRYVERGLMPALARIKAEGAWGELQSTNPPTTPPAWSTCVTGKDPGEHGVFDFRESFHADPARPLITGRSIRARKIWDLVGDAGGRSCVLNFPVSYPAEEIDGVFVCGMMTPDGDREYAWPAGETARLLAAAPGYTPNVDIPRYDVRQLDSALGFLDDLDRSLDARIAAFWHYWGQRDWAFFFPTFVFGDRLGHLFWKMMVEGEGFDDHPHAAVVRPRVEAMFGRFDAMLGRILDERPDDLLLAMCSDHGFGSTRTFFEVNAWLEHLGLLVLRPKARVRSRAFYAAMEIGEGQVVRELLPGALQAAVRGRIRSRRSSFSNDLADAVDWTRTKAFFSAVPVQGITICRAGPGRPGGVSGDAEYDRVRRTIREGLLALEAPDGAPAVDRVWRREELYRGPYLRWAPDLVFVARDYACLGRPVLGARRWFRDSGADPNGFHRMQGIWLAHGPGVQAGRRVEGARIADVTPTLLHAMGLAVPDDMDGSVLQDCFEQGWRRAHPVRFCEAKRWEGGDAFSHDAADTEALTERLRGLGYVD